MIKIITTEGIAIMLRQLCKPFLGLCLFVLALGTSTWNTTCSGATIIGAPVALSTLLVPGGNIVVGDKTFTNFGYTFTGDMPGPVGVNVVPITDDAGNFGIRFQAAFIDLPSSVGGSDALITYKVTAGPGRLISDAHIEGNPNLLGTTGSISVTETFLPLGQNDEFTMKIYDDEGQPVPKLVDNTIFTTPVQSLDVQKDILAIVPTTASSATMSFVDQTFSQIPEPASALLVLGGIAILGFARKRRQLT